MALSAPALAKATTTSFVSTPKPTMVSTKASPFSTVQFATSFPTLLQ